MITGSFEKRAPGAIICEQIAPSPAADFWERRSGEMVSVIPEIFNAFGPQRVYVRWNFAEVFSSY